MRELALIRYENALKHQCSHCWILLYQIRKRGIFYLPCRPVIAISFTLNQPLLILSNRTVSPYWQSVVGLLGTVPSALMVSLYLSQDSPSQTQPAWEQVQVKRWLPSVWYRINCCTQCTWFRFILNQDLLPETADVLDLVARSRSIARAAPLVSSLLLYVRECSTLDGVISSACLTLVAEIGGMKYIFVLVLV